ncbi:signal recognition particle-docking protein FtsY [Succinispira mobilis]|uniref:signal recognition particle-docking protein FtsY n=1 Tax=Succinispira mobilis TaxID=78120 RepID=UPI00036114E3|nr:signal recognition particle-docking protein FtsY [Succinispira mobilis]
MSFFERLKDGLSKTRKNFTEKIEALVSSSLKIDEDFLEELEAVLITADVGNKVVQKLLLEIKIATKDKIITQPEQVIPFLQEKISEILAKDLQGTRISGKPTVILVVGVNGVGKTTTIGKLGNYYNLLGYKVMFAAADTFRAAASEQLEIWAERANATIIKQGEGADPAAVVFDALQAAKARNVDVLFIDTAGRLHNKDNLMKELEKIHRVIKRELPDAPHETFLVLDATTGQNALNQADVFTKVANVTGIVLTKLDGTAKGGIVLGIKEQANIPVKWIGVGEKLHDFRPFSPEEFAKALFDK